MDHTDARILLRSLVDVFVDGHGKTEEDLTTADLLNLAVEFYDVPCNGCSREDGGDILLFQCNTVDWGQGAGLVVDFVRQFSILDFLGEYSQAEQLRATLLFPAELAAGNDVAISLWSSDCASLADFCQQVKESAAYRLTENVRAEGLKIEQERV